MAEANPLLDAALTYASKGWKVFPCQPGGQDPLGELAPHGVHSATTDAATIQRWWKAQPEANIGLAPDPLAFVDVDAHGERDGRMDWLELADELSLPETVTVSTPGQGWHFWWLGQAKNAADVIPGIELRVDGWYVLAPPSRRADGIYTFTPGHSPDEVDVAPLPAELVARLTKKKQPDGERIIIERSDAWLVPALRGGLSEGELRNSTATRLAGLLRRRGFTGEQILELLRGWNLRNSEPLPESELVKVAHSVARYQPEARCSGALTLSEIASKAGSLSWAWPGWIPSGCLSMILGAQNVGKSFFAAHAIAVLTGAIAGWPDGTKPERTGRVILAETEGFRSEYARRLLALGVKPDAVLFPTDAEEDAFFVADLLRDLEALADLAIEVDAAALVVDSLSGGHSLDENSADMRRVLKALAQLAGELSIPVLVVHHLRKKNALEADAGRPSIDRARGSSTVTQFTRAILGIWREDDSPEAPARLEVVKLNFGRPPVPLGFTIGESGLVFCAAPEPVREQTVTERAAEFLRAKLQSQPVLASELVTQAELEGISRRSLYRARQDLALRTTDGHWTLPATGTWHRENSGILVTDGTAGTGGTDGTLGTDGTAGTGGTLCQSAKSANVPGCHDGDSLATDPRPDLEEDSARWKRLLSLAKAAPSDLRAALHGLRSEGARLVANGSGVRLVAAGDPEAYRADRERYLAPYSDALTAMLEAVAG